MDRDYSSGTALQEISFWLNLEKALQRIQEKRDSQEVTLTLDILKYAKRFHATVSFDSDTGEDIWFFVNMFQCKILHTSLISCLAEENNMHRVF